MSLDMLDAIFMARRGVLRAQRTPYDAQFALCCYYRAATDQHRRRAANNGERVPPGRPQEQPSHGPTASLPRLPRQIPARRVRKERPSRTWVGDRGRAVSPPIDSIHRFRHPNTKPNVCGVGMELKKIQINL